VNIDELQYILRKWRIALSSMEPALAKLARMAAKAATGGMRIALSVAACVLLLALAVHAQELNMQELAAKNYYELIGVSKDVAQKDLVRALRKAAAQFHPGAPQRCAAAAPRGQAARSTCRAHFEFRPAPRACVRDCRARCGADVRWAPLRCADTVRDEGEKKKKEKVFLRIQKGTSAALAFRARSRRPPLLATCTCAEARVSPGTDGTCARAALRSPGGVRRPDDAPPVRQDGGARNHRLRLREAVRDHWVRRKPGARPPSCSYPLRRAPRAAAAPTSPEATRLASTW
jgi:hypothetical protein